jgi:hypothetical protein
MILGEQLAGPIVQTIFECRNEFTFDPALCVRGNT